MDVDGSALRERLRLLKRPIGEREIRLRRPGQRQAASALVSLPVSPRPQTVAKFVRSCGSHALHETRRKRGDPVIPFGHAVNVARCRRCFWRKSDLAWGRGVLTTLLRLPRG